MKYLHVQPHDPLFFRDGMPFGMGEDLWIHSSVIPAPSVFWGAMFTTLYATGKVSLNDKDKLSIKAVYLYNHNTKQVYIPAPLDIFVDDKKKTYSQSFIQADSFIHNSSLPNFIAPIHDHEVEQAEGYFMPLTDLLRHYPFKDKYPYITLLDTSSFSKSYKKLGIKRNKQTLTTDDEAIYRIEMIEYGEDWGFVVAYESEEDLPQKGFLKLGGEGKVAQYQEIAEPYYIHVFNEEQKAIVDEFDICKIYIQSAVVLPNSFYEDLGIEAAVIGKPINIGGFDAKLREPKTMERAIPAGSILVATNDKNLAIETWTQLIQKKLTHSSFNQNGFGCFQVLPIYEFN